MDVTAAFGGRPKVLESAERNPLRADPERPSPELTVLLIDSLLIDLQGHATICMQSWRTRAYQWKSCDLMSISPTLSTWTCDAFTEMTLS